MKSKAVERSTAYENLITEGNFEKLSFFTRGIMNELIRREDELSNARQALYDTAGKYRILCNSLSE